MDKFTLRELRVSSKTDERPKPRRTLLNKHYYKNSSIYSLFTFNIIIIV